MVRTRIFYLLYVGINNMTAFVVEKLRHACVFIEHNVHAISDIFELSGIVNLLIKTIQIILIQTEKIGLESLKTKIFN